ncbi:MAG: hypothetical protein J5632_02555 [Bacteroidales bacterium]|nr:hypothetical protein [Bacteroidales bacterium]
MKKLLVIIAVVAVIAGISVSGCRRSGPAKSSSDSFNTFNGGILDYDYWKSIKNPGVLGLDDAVTLAIGRGGYENPEVFGGKVTWTLSETGVLEFILATRSQVSGKGSKATGSIIGIKAVGSGTVTVIATDAHGNTYKHEFRVGKGQHYKPDAEWSELPSSSGYPHDDEASSSSEDEEESSSSDLEEYSSSSEEEEESSSSAEPDDL